MDFPTGGYFGTTSSQEPVYSVPPLNSIPPMPQFTSSSKSARPTEPTNQGGPTMLISPRMSSQEMEYHINFTKSGVLLTGNAAIGQVGPIIGKLDIGEMEDSYFFRMSLPGVARDESLNCDVDGDGKVLIKGVTITGEKIVCRKSQVFEMKTRNLCPPGEFSILFQLPGPVDHQGFSGTFNDGILEGSIKKR